MLVPVRDNEGRRFPRSAWRELERRLVQSGGLSLTPRVTGVWQSGGRVYRDINRQYVVSLTSWTQLPDWLGVVRWARDYFRQEAMYIEVAGVPEVIEGTGR